MIKCYKNATAYDKLKSYGTKNKRVELILEKINGKDLILWQKNDDDMLLKAGTKNANYYNIIPLFTGHIIVLAVPNNYYKDHLKIWHNEENLPFTENFSEELTQPYNSLW